MYAILWMYFAKQVDMIRHTCTARKCRCDLHLNDLYLLFRRYFANYIFQSDSNFINKHLAAILWAPYNMILTGINNIAGTFKSTVTTHGVIGSKELEGEPIKLRIVLKA